MDADDLDGSIVLERLAEVGSVDAFWSAVDADDFDAARRLMRAADIEPELIQAVLEQMREAGGEEHI